MTLALPDEALSSNPLNQFDTPFLMGLHAFEAMRDAQLEWWRAWSGLLGQIAPLPEEVVADKPEPKGA